VRHRRKRWWCYNFCSNDTCSYINTTTLKSDKQCLL